MNRCTYVDEVLHVHVPWQPLESYWISKSYLKVKIAWCFCVFFCAAATHGCMKICRETSRSLLNFTVKGQGHMGFCGFLCACYCGYLRTVLSLEQGLMILFCFVVKSVLLFLFSCCFLFTHFLSSSTAVGWLLRYKMFITRIDFWGPA